MHKGSFIRHFLQKGQRVATNLSIRDPKIAVYGKRLTSRNFFVIKSKSRTVECLSYTIYYRNLKCCFKTLCMTTETLSLMGISLGHPSLDVRVDV